MEKKGHITVRLPVDLRAWIEEQAERNGASQNSEVIRAIRERMDRTGVDLQKSA